MKFKNLIIALAVIAISIAGVGLILKLSPPGKGAAKPVFPQKAMKPAAKEAIARKAFSKDMGGLTIQILNAKNKVINVKARAFRSVDPKSSVYVRSLVSGKTQELAPGSYDIILDTAPQMISKGISISKGRETVENLGCVTGILTVKMMNAKNKAAFSPLRIYYSKTGIMVAAASANRPIELLAGTYDVEIGVLPKTVETAVSIEQGKEKVLDLGVMTGALIVKILDENKVEKKDARQSVKVKKADNNELVLNTRVNKSVEIRQGAYNIEVGTVPPQINKDVKVNPGAETVLEIVIQSPAKAKTPVAAAVPAPPKAKAPVAVPVPAAAGSAKSG